MTAQSTRRALLGLAILLAATALVLTFALGGGRRSAPPGIGLKHRPGRQTGSAWTGGGIPEPRFLAPDSVWNAPLSANAPLDPSSSALSAAVTTMVAEQGAALDVKRWSTPIYIVPAGQPRLYMHLSPNPKTGRVNPDLQRAFSAVPVPPSAQPALGTDQLMVIYQPSSDTMWESWHTRVENGGWHFDYGGRMVHVSQNPGYYERILGPDGSVVEQPWWGPSATSLPLADSVITFRDLRNGYIDHALALDLPHFWIRAHVLAWPAERGDGASTAANSVPEGAHFRLDPSLNIDSLGLPPLTRMIAYAAQRYGFIVRDGSSDVTIDGQAPRTDAQAAAWQESLSESGFRHFSQVLGTFPWSHLQLLKMKLVPNP